MHTAIADCVCRPRIPKNPKHTTTQVSEPISPQHIRKTRGSAPLCCERHIGDALELLVDLKQSRDKACAEDHPIRCNLEQGSEQAGVPQQNRSLGRRFPCLVGGDAAERSSQVLDL